MEANQKPNSVGDLLIPTIVQSPIPDSTVILEELLWKVLNFATLRQCSVSFFDIGKKETTVSRWARAMTRASKVGKGLSKNEKAQKLYLKHWLEAIDPLHRYGVNLNRYHDVWCNSESSQPFFYWLDIGDGKEVVVEKCSRSDLQSQCIKYLGPKEREAYEVILKNGKLIYKKSGVCVDTIEGTKWMFVLSTSRTLYVGQKQTHFFHHSSFLAGGASLSSGRLVVSEGDLEQKLLSLIEPVSELLAPHAPSVILYQLPLTSPPTHPTLTPPFLRETSSPHHSGADPRRSLWNGFGGPITGAMPPPPPNTPYPTTTN
ncbi:IQ domain-containing protein iqm6 [Datura stramonium]|uniref:IQ domain-containing protein iqm6 n=1 Tax=Datura stramonium TaxID=4076 RepID=A0ABS8RJ02_DATST|nr:IQ domain-containing protein iqm6 [Datura stramonium]